MLTGNVPDVICTFDSDADDFMRMKADVSGLLCHFYKCNVKLYFTIYTINCAGC